MKSLDKKKTKVDYSKPVEPIMTADNVIVGYKNVQNKTKELDCPKCKGIGCWNCTGTGIKPNTPQSEPKELDWDKELEKTIMEKLLEQFHCKGGKTLNGEDVYLMTKSDIDNLLTQQRKELLEEINKLPDLTTTEFGEETISRLEVINLLNNKDE